jgi:L-ascorbate metabolism protein UlaG (beta-lactamase superfamily)
MSSEPADVIFITHDHYDHLDLDDIKKIQKEGTTIVTTEDGAKKLSGNIKTIKAGDTLTVDEIQVEAVPAYNIGKDFHPKASGWVGFILTIGGQRIYHPGDTDLIPEMDSIETDIALLPVGGTYTMTAEEAAEAANKIKPKIVVPMHFGTIVGSIEDAEKFKEKCEVPVQILTPE